MAANYSKETKNLVFSMMVDGKTDTEIHEILAISTNTLRKWRRSFGLHKSSGGNIGLYSEDDNNRAIQLMNDGMNNAEIADTLDISATTIANWRKKAGIANSVKWNNNKYSEDDNNRAIQMMNDGMNNAEIADTLDISATAIANWRKKAGIANSVKWNNKKYSQKLKKEAIMQMLEGLTNNEISKALDISRTTLYDWRKKEGLPPSSSGKKSYTIEQINDVIDMIRDEFTLGEIEKKTGVARSRIKKIHTEEIRTGNPLPSIKLGFARRAKYSDEELIDLALLNRGYGFNRFIEFLAVSNHFVFDLFQEFKEFTSEDPYQVLQDVSNHTLVKELQYREITGNNQLPVGFGRGTGPRASGENKGNHKFIPLPPQIFFWGRHSKRN
jgi:transposase-like protein